MSYDRFYLLRLDNRNALQLWVPAAPGRGPNAVTDVEEHLAWVRRYAAPAPQWLLYAGSIWNTGANYTRTQLTLATKRPEAMKGHDWGERIGRLVVKGTLDEVWPMFEAHARML